MAGARHPSRHGARAGDAIRETRPHRPAVAGRGLRHRSDPIHRHHTPTGGQATNAAANPESVAMDCRVIHYRLRCSLAFSSPCFVALRRSVNHILNVCSFPRALRALPDNEYAALNVFRGFATLHFRLPARTTEWEVSPVVERRNNKQPSFSPLLFVISAEGGNDEQ